MMAEGIREVLDKSRGSVQTKFGLGMASSLQSHARHAEHVNRKHLALRREVAEHSVHINSGSVKEKERSESKTHVLGSKSKGQKAVKLAQLLSLTVLTNAFGR